MTKRLGWFLKCSGRSPLNFPIYNVMKKKDSDKYIGLFLENLPKLVIGVWLIIALKKASSVVSNLGAMDFNLGGEVSTSNNEPQRVEEIEKQVEENQIRYLNDGRQVTAEILNAHAKILVSEGFGWNLAWYNWKSWRENEKVITDILLLYSNETFKFISDAYRLVTIDTNKVGRDLLSDCITKLSYSDVQSLEHLRGVGLVV